MHISGNKYEAVLFDMDSKDRTMGLSCPPKQFLDDNVLEDVKSILSENGKYTLNIFLIININLFIANLRFLRLDIEKFEVLCEE